MKVSEGMSPAVFKNMSLVIGLFIVYTVWQGVNNKIADFRYEPVYGESFASAGDAEKVDLKSLPIVIAQSDVVVADDNVLNEQAIENAFKIPEFATEEVDEPKITVAEKMFLSYRPAVSAITNNGAVINGVFWKVGEKMNTMPVMLETGEFVFPVIAGVSRSRVVLRVSGEKLTLPFERF